MGLTFFSIRHMTQHDPAWWQIHLQLIEEEAIRTTDCAQRTGVALQVCSLAGESLLTGCQHTVCYADDSRVTRFMARSSS